jgi:integrase
VPADLDTDTRELAALLLLLGVRRGNLQRARWEQIDLAAKCWRIPPAERERFQVRP